MYSLKKPVTKVSGISTFRAAVAKRDDEPAKPRGHGCYLPDLFPLV